MAAAVDPSMAAGPERLRPEALVALVATAACRLILLLLRNRRPQGWAHWRFDFAAACEEGLKQLHGTPEQRQRAAFMCASIAPATSVIMPCAPHHAVWATTICETSYTRMLLLPACATATAMMPR